MRRAANIILIILLVILGFALGRSTSDVELSFTTDTPREYPLPPTPPEPTVVEDLLDEVVERRLVVETPTEGAGVGTAVVVSGRADAAEVASVTITVLDSGQQVLLETVVPLVRGSGFARFSETVAMDVSGVVSAGRQADDRRVIMVTARDAAGVIIEQAERHVFREDDMVAVSVYFQNPNLGSDGDDICVSVASVERRVSARSNVYRATIEELLKGPTAEERTAGYTTSVPDRVVVKDIGADANGIVTVNFTAALDRNVAGSCRVGAIRTQIERTLGQFPEVRGVVIAVEGNVNQALQP